MHSLRRRWAHMEAVRRIEMHRGASTRSLLRLRTHVVHGAVVADDDRLSVGAQRRAHVAGRLAVPAGPRHSFGREGLVRAGKERVVMRRDVEPLPARLRQPIRADPRSRRVVHEQALASADQHEPGEQEDRCFQCPENI